MEKTVKQKMMESLIAFGKLYQLQNPSQEYFETLRIVLHENKWRLSEFNNVLNLLLKDEKYADAARFGKYPTINDFFRIRQQTRSKPFYDALSAYLSGGWWEKDTVLMLASPAQINAITASGGLSKLYERANGEMSTPVYKLVDIISQNEAEAPAELIDIKHRIGAPQTLQQITNDYKKDAK